MAEDKKDDGVLYKTNLLGLDFEYTKKDAAIDVGLIGVGALVGGVGAGPAALLAGLRSGVMMLGRGLVKAVTKEGVKEGAEAIGKAAVKSVNSVKSAATSTGKFLTGSPSRLGILGFASAPALIYTGTALTEHESGGAVSEKAFDASVNYIKGKIKEGLTIDEIEAKLDGLDYIVQVSNAYEKSAQNLYVREIMNHNSGADAIAKGKQAAVSFQLLPNNAAMLVAKQAVRTAVVDDMFKNKDEADKYLAAALVDDIVKNAQVRALDGNQVRKEDVHAAITKFLNNPDEHPVASKFFQERGRLANGFRQILPKATPVAPVEVAAVAPPQADGGVLGRAKRATETLRENASDVTGQAVEGANEIADDILDAETMMMKQIAGAIGISEEDLDPRNAKETMKRFAGNNKAALAIGTLAGVKAEGGIMKKSMVGILTTAILAPLIKMFEPYLQAIGQLLKPFFDSFKNHFAQYARPETAPAPATGSPAAAPKVSALEATGLDVSAPAIKTDVALNRDFGTARTAKPEEPTSVVAMGNAIAQIFRPKQSAILMQPSFA